MKALKIYSLILLTLPVLASCTKVIKLDFGNDSNKLVIEATLNNAIGTQTVKLSRNVPFDNTNTYPPVTGATVSLSDQTGSTRKFTEASPGVYTRSNLGGLPGETYTMSVLADAKTYTATSTMPAGAKFDSLTSKNSVINTAKGKKVITVNYQDPAGVVNQYRFIVWINGVQVKTVYAANDDFNDGRYVSLDLRVRDADDSDFGIYAGNTVTVEMQCIDKPVYTYWYSLQQQGSNNPGGSVTPADPPTNISPVVLGYFSAHTTQSKTIVVK